MSEEEKKESAGNSAPVSVAPGESPAQTLSHTETRTEDVVEAEEESTAPQTSNIITSGEKSGFQLPKIKLPKLSEIPDKLRHWFSEYKRVIIVSRKPDIEELSKISKISGLGILAIGLLGFIIQLVFQLIKGV
ncbi:MAG: protein translocase SEC61 complex subunit gamma [Candidatus Nanoarchaeia archaeon]|nr:protein translocase SEC61 complex subunit gamma [Candidatus Nanoarchaeia archaeon]MDD5239186.1 protein translocase SEC61 complex subunit gamma [Candidatus Nanoarchaeia archaeon]